MQINNLIRETKSVCPECLETIKADILEDNGKVYMAKECLKHGKFRLLLSNHPWYYRQLSDFYFSVMTKSFPQRDYIVNLTNKCNLDCPICLADSNLYNDGDYPSDKLTDFLKGKRNFKIDLMGSEPTMREDLPDIISMIARSGNVAALHTNGIKISEFSYLERLKKAGLREVHLQFDGFDDRIYETIRGKKLLDIKFKALDNLERLNISTDLKVTVVRGVNENQMAKILDCAVKHKFIKEVFFLGCRYLGRAKGLSFERCLMPDELIDILENQTSGKISRENIFLFQKLYFSLLAAFSVKKCFYNQHFLIKRRKNGYTAINEIIDLKDISAKLDKIKNSKLSLISIFLKFRYISRLKDLIPMAFSFVRGFRLAKVSDKTILLGFISACDAYSFDHQIADNCGKGAISVGFGIRDIGAVDNVFREKRGENSSACK
jgi:sulfatase maturation enzyme AslB (radical SAM superfamily)